MSLSLLPLHPFSIYLSMSISCPPLSFYIFSIMFFCLALNLYTCLSSYLSISLYIYLFQPNDYFLLFIFPFLCTYTHPSTGFLCTFFFSLSLFHPFFFFSSLLRSHETSFPFLLLRFPGIYLSHRFCVCVDVYVYDYVFMCVCKFISLCEALVVFFY